MKKLLCMLLATVMLMSVVGCSTNQNQTEEQFEEQNVTQEEQQVDVETVETLVNKDGKVFSPDLTKSGVTSKKIPLNSNQIELCGKTYTMPVRVSDLIADGWKLTSNNFKNEFKPKTKTSLVSFSMQNDAGAYISLGEAYNDTDTMQKLENCWLTEFYVDYLNADTTQVDFIFPGGIVKGSTAKDVVSVYGDPNNSKLFTKHSYNLEKQLSYNEHKDSGMSFSYVFEDNGLLRYAKISANVD